MLGFAAKSLINAFPDDADLAAIEDANYDLLVDGETLLSFDWSFAHLIVKDQNISSSAFALVMAVVALSRQGHICLDLGHLQNYGFNQSLQDAILHGLKDLHSALIDELSDPAGHSIKPFVRFQQCVYLQQNDYFETIIFVHLRRLMSSVPSLRISPEVIGDQLKMTSLTTEQKMALTHTMGYALAVISGGPGRGKTFVAAHYAEMLKSFFPRSTIAITAPTGKAAMRLEQSLSKLMATDNFFVGTIHALLGIKNERQFLRENFYLDADLIIVDESSMIDVKLFAALLSSVKKGARILLMGDENQLPPVEVGSIFTALCQYAKNSGLLCYRHLSTCLRTDQEDILNLAEDVLAGRAEKIPFLSLKSSSINDLLPAEFWRYARLFAFSKQSPEALFPKLGQYQILSSLRKGPFGAHALNEIIYQQLLTECTSQQFFLPILIGKNDAKNQLANGQQGILVVHRDSSKKNLDYALFAKEEGFCQLARYRLPLFEISFAMSVHKSQGSEYEHVFYFMPPGSENFGRELVYTAVTRARKSITIATERAILKQSVQKFSFKSCGLSARLRH